MHNLPIEICVNEQSYLTPVGNTNKVKSARRANRMMKQQQRALRAAVEISIFAFVAFV